MTKTEEPGRIEWDPATGRYGVTVTRDRVVIGSGGLTLDEIPDELIRHGIACVEMTARFLNVVPIAFCHFADRAFTTEWDRDRDVVVAYV